MKDTSGLTKGNDKALDGLNKKRKTGERLTVKRLEKGESSKTYRIRAPDWVHRLLDKAQHTTSLEESKAKALGDFISTKLSLDDELELDRLQKKLASMTEKYKQNS